MWSYGKVSMTVGQGTLGEREILEVGGGEACDLKGQSYTRQKES